METCKPRSIDISPAPAPDAASIARAYRLIPRIQSPIVNSSGPQLNIARISSKTKTATVVRLTAKRPHLHRHTVDCDLLAGRPGRADSSSPVTGVADASRLLFQSRLSRQALSSPAHARSEKGWL